MIKWSIHKEDLPIRDVYGSNNRASSKTWCSQRKKHLKLEILTQESTNSFPKGPESNYFGLWVHSSLCVCMCVFITLWESKDHS